MRSENNNIINVAIKRIIPWKRPREDNLEWRLTDIVILPQDVQNSAHFKKAVSDRIDVWVNQLAGKKISPI